MSHPFLVFSFLAEQYIFAVFWLILFLHTVMQHRPYRNFLFAGAAGSLTTSSFFFFLLSDANNRKNWLVDIMIGGLTCLAIIALFGRLAYILTPIRQLQYLGQWGGGGLVFYDKFLIFLNFVQACFVQPRMEVTVTLSGYPCYNLEPVHSLNTAGLMFLLVAMAGFVINIDNKFARICFAWIAFSWLLIGVAGWGTAEHSTGLYVYYFGWAYFCLAFLAIEKLLQKLPPVKYTVYVAIIAALAWINIPGMYDLIQFGIKYYPCQ